MCTSAAFIPTSKRWEHPFIPHLHQTCHYPIKHFLLSDGGSKDSPIVAFIWISIISSRLNIVSKVFWSFGFLLWWYVSPSLYPLYCKLFSLLITNTIFIPNIFALKFLSFILFLPYFLPLPSSFLSLFFFCSLFRICLVSPFIWSSLFSNFPHNECFTHVSYKQQKAGLKKTKSESLYFNSSVQCFHLSCYIWIFSYHFNFLHSLPSFFVLSFLLLDWPALKKIPLFSPQLGLEGMCSTFPLYIIIKLWTSILQNLKLINSFSMRNRNHVECFIFGLLIRVLHVTVLSLFEFQLVFKSPLKFASLVHPHPESVQLSLCFFDHHCFLRFPPSFWVQFLIFFHNTFSQFFQQQPLNVCL